MKILEIDCNYYYYPEGVCRLEDFIAYANEHYNSFIELTQLEMDNCAFPYFIKENVKQVFVNIARMEIISEVEGSVICRLDYDARLEQVVKKKCVDCVHFEDDSVGDNLEGHREKISLDGYCWGYEKKDK